MKNGEIHNALQTIVLKIGETHITREQVKFKCYGLGSCVGLFLYDLETSNTAGAHILLPGTSREGESPLAFTVDAVTYLIDGLIRLGSNLSNLRAKVVGGANVLNISSITVGLENIQSVRDELEKKQISITSMNVGGTFVRSAEFYSNTQEMFVTSIDATLYSTKL